MNEVLNMENKEKNILKSNSEKREHLIQITNLEKKKDELVYYLKEKLMSKIDLQNEIYEKYEITYLAKDILYFDSVNGDYGKFNSNFIKKYIENHRVKHYNKTIWENYCEKLNEIYDICKPSHKDTIDILLKSLKLIIKRLNINLEKKSSKISNQSDEDKKYIEINQDQSIFQERKGSNPYVYNDYYFKNRNNHKYENSVKEISHNDNTLPDIKKSKYNQLVDTKLNIINYNKEKIKFARNEICDYGLSKKYNFKLKCIIENYNTEINNNAQSPTKKLLKHQIPDARVQIHENYSKSTINKISSYPRSKSPIKIPEKYLRF